jgi:hypothetical protein
MRKIFINLSDVAAAEHTPEKTFYMGAPQLACLQIHLKQGGVIVIDELDKNNYNEYMNMLGFFGPVDSGPGANLQSSFPY